MGVLKHIKYSNRKNVMILFIPILNKKDFTAPKHLPESITKDVIKSKKINLKFINELNLLFRNMFTNLNIM